VADCSREGFLTAMDISCYSFIRMAHLAEPLMTDGGCLLTTSYYGGERVVEHYNVMGPVKSALESAVKYLAVEMGMHRIRVNALSPGPIMTRAAGGIADFDKIISETQRKSPLSEILTIDDVGATAAFLASDGARHITGNITYIDCGYHVMG
jgi:enoyl-[acyl-carrier protein] reductase I